MELRENIYIYSIHIELIEFNLTDLRVSLFGQQISSKMYVMKKMLLLNSMI